MNAQARIVVIAGFDPTGRAGLLADVATAAQWNVRCAGVATCLTAQGGATYLRQVTATSMLTAALDGIAKTGPVHGIKVGALANRTQFDSTVRWAQGFQVPKVIDPVIATSKGERLSTLRASDFARARGFIVTPNTQEFEDAGLAPEEWLSAAIAALVVKGGASAKDRLWTKAGHRTYRGRFIASAARGTGCRFATALCVALVQGHTLDTSVRRARYFVREHLRSYNATLKRST